MPMERRLRKSNFTISPSTVKPKGNEGWHWSMIKVCVKVAMRVRTCAMEELNCQVTVKHLNRLVKNYC